ncbi:M23 family metallopeptidase [Mycobacterium sp. ITM-2016-00318]|uniref:M23 family metallopeptidase n=1 Tax=Mycobacterium sp. ITM-2016-00318 TaxID=2099693 RepID=UPI000CF898FC
MAGQRAFTSPHGGATNARLRWVDPEATEITDIIPFNEFGKLSDLEFHHSSAFDREAQVVHAPELDDMHHTDDLIPLRLAVPSRFRPEARDERRSSSSRGARNATHAYRDSNTDVSNGVAATDIFDLSTRRAAQHRKETAGAVKGRLMIAAMAAGATAAAAHSVINNDDTATGDTVLAADQSAMAGGAITGSSDGMQVVTVASAVDSVVHAEEITKAAAFAQERADREARLQRPMFVMPTKGVFTSGFGYRWGALHAGVDIANSIGTPIYAAADGVVVDAGPTAGYGAWVKLRHADGTVTLYGHVNTWNVSIGQRVWAGDQIATIGNRGNSTGPHLHFEVHQNGTDRIDPVGWLAKRGISLGGYSP